MVSNSKSLPFLNLKMMSEFADISKKSGWFCFCYRDIFFREYFEYGPLDAYLRENKNRIENVDMLEAATSLARALYYLQEKVSIYWICLFF